MFFFLFSKHLIHLKVENENLQIYQLKICIPVICLMTIVIY